MSKLSVAIGSSILAIVLIFIGLFFMRESPMEDDYKISYSGINSSQRELFEHIFNQVKPQYFQGTNKINVVWEMPPGEIYQSLCANGCYGIANHHAKEIFILYNSSIEQYLPEILCHELLHLYGDKMLSENYDGFTHEDVYRMGADLVCFNLP